MDEQEAGALVRLAGEADFLGPETEKWVEQLAPQRAAFLDVVRFLVRKGQESRAAEVAANTWRLWHLLGDLKGSREFVAAALDVSDPKPSRARALALYGDGLLAFRAGDLKHSTARNETSLAVARQAQDLEAEALALVGLSRVALREGDYERVRSLATQSRQLASGLAPSAQVAPLHLHAAGTRLMGDYDQALALYNESLDLNRRLGDTYMVAVELHNMGHVEMHRGNTDKAESLFAECAKLRGKTDPYNLAMSDLNQAVLDHARGRTEEAATLLSRMKATLNKAGIVLDPDDAFEAEWLEQALGSRKATGKSERRSQGPKR